MIVKMLEISTAHITPETAEGLGFAAEQPDNLFAGTLVVFAKGSYEPSGFIMLIADIGDDEMSAPEFPEDLKKVISFAQENGCEWLMLDAGAPEVDDLPTYEWP